MDDDCPHCAHASRTVDYGFGAFGGWDTVMPIDSFEALAAASLASEANRFDSAVRWDEVLPWWAEPRRCTVRWARALDQRHEHCDWVEPTERHVLPVYDGDRPADLTDKMLADARSWEPEYRNRCRTRDQRALVFREAIHDRGRGDGYAASVRETHRAVHEALAGESTKGCKWCEESGR